MSPAFQKALLPCPSQHQNSPTHVLLFFWFHWSELEMRRQQSTKPSNVWFFQKISRSNLCLTDPWQLQISLFLSLLALHLVEKLSDSRLCQAAQVFIMCIHRKKSHILHTSKAWGLQYFNKHSGNSDKTTTIKRAALIYVAFFNTFIEENDIFCLSKSRLIRTQFSGPLWTGTIEIDVFAFFSGWLSGLVFFVVVFFSSPTFWNSVSTFNVSQSFHLKIPQLPAAQRCSNAVWWHAWMQVTNKYIL